MIQVENAPSGSQGDLRKAHPDLEKAFVEKLEVFSSCKYSHVANHLGGFREVFDILKGALKKLLPARDGDS